MSSKCFGEPGRTTLPPTRRPKPPPRPGQHLQLFQRHHELIARILADRLGGEEALLTRLQENLFAPLGITGAVPKVDGTGLWKASELLLLHGGGLCALRPALPARGGCWEDRPLLEESWVNGARTPTTLTAEEGYGLHWWIDPRTLGASTPAATRGSESSAIPPETCCTPRGKPQTEKYRGSWHPFTPSLPRFRSLAARPKG